MCLYLLFSTRNQDLISISIKVRRFSSISSLADQYVGRMLSIQRIKVSHPPLVHEKAPPFGKINHERSQRHRLMIDIMHGHSRNQTQYRLPDTVSVNGRIYDPACQVYFRRNTPVKQDIHPSRCYCL
jgi:hypothetical protein